MTKKIEFIDLKAQYADLRETINARIQRVLDHGQFIMGPEVKELEDALQAFTSSQHCITVASGTEALLIAMMALGIKTGDEIITSPFTFVATAEMIVMLGATPVLVDIDAETCNIAPSAIESVITPRTRAIMPVSLYGQTADMDEINAIALRHGLAVIEDAAQSFGANYHGGKSCNLSTIGATSFFPSKPLGCYGDGGAVFTNDATIAKAMREIRVHGQERRYYHTRIGVGGRMDTLQCAVVLAKLTRFEREIAARLRIGARYTQLLAQHAPAIRPVRVRADRTSVYAQYTIRVGDRDGVIKRLQAEEVPTAVHYPVPIHLQPAYRQYAPRWSLAQAELAAQEVLSLPMHPDLDSTTQDRIVTAVAAATMTN